MYVSYIHDNHPDAILIEEIISSFDLNHRSILQLEERQKSTRPHLSVCYGRHDRAISSNKLIKGGGEPRMYRLSLILRAISKVCRKMGRTMRWSGLACRAVKAAMKGRT